MTDLRKLLDEATPAPWNIGGRKNPKSGGAVAMVNSPLWGNFARVVVRFDDEEADDAGGLANARLIAMAPGLAAALIKAEGELAYYQDQFCEGFCLDVPPGFTSKEMEIECSGCRARATLTEIRKLTGAA